MRKKKRGWCIANSERDAANHLAKRLANPEKYAQIQARANEAWVRSNPEKVSAKAAKWAQANKGNVNARASRRRASRIRRTPAWASLDAIQEIYIEAVRLSALMGIPYEVDHVIPLQGRTVSGFHIETNLQIITRKANGTKYNKFEVVPCEF